MRSNVSPLGSNELLGGDEPENAERTPLEIKMRAFSPNDEYIITINGCPVGGILTREQASTIVDWMRGALAELTIAFA